MLGGVLWRWRPTQVRNGSTRSDSPALINDSGVASSPQTMLSRQLRSLSLGRWAQQASRSPLVLRRHLATPATPPSPNDPFANGTNAYYAEEMYRHWRQDPNSVHASWNVYFSGLDKGLPSSKAFSPPPSLLPAPADGAPALHSNGGAELDVHLKVGCTLSFVIHLLTCITTDATACSSISSSRTPCRRTRPFRHS